MSFDLSHLPTPFASAVTSLAEAVGFPEDQILVLGCLLSSVVIGQIHRHLTSPTVRHVMSILLGLLYGYTIFGLSFAHVLLMPTIAYFLKDRPTWVAVWTMGYLSTCHIWRMKVDYLGWKMDFTSSLMLAVVKSWTFAYNYYDYVRLSKAKKDPEFQLHKKSFVHDYLAQQALRHEPNFFHYMSFILFYGGLIAGPVFEYNHYIDFQNLSLFKRAGYESTPPSLYPAIKRIGYAALCFPIVFLFGFTPVLNFVHTPAFIEKFSLFQRIVYFWPVVSAFRYKYYFAWYLAEAGCISTGLGFSPRSSKETNTIHWDHTSNVVLKDVEFHISVLYYTNNWNRSINGWLKYYVFYRVSAPKSITKMFGGAKTVAMLVTRSVSAFWHGFYSAYYLFFLNVMLVNFMEDSIRAAMDAFPIPEKGTIGRKILTYVRFLLTMFAMNYMGTSFVILRARWTLEFWKSVAFSGHIVCIVIWLLLRAITPKKKKNADAKKADTKKTQ